jgi:hypothetical protein
MMYLIILCFFTNKCWLNFFLIIRNKTKQEEENLKKETEIRETIVRKRLLERMMSAKNQIKFDINKFPLLSSPSEMYKAKLLKNKSTSQITSNSFNSSTNPTLISQSSFDDPSTKSSFSYLSESNSNKSKKNKIKENATQRGQYIYVYIHTYTYVYTYIHTGTLGRPLSWSKI